MPSTGRAVASPATTAPAKTGFGSGRLLPAGVPTKCWRPRSSGDTGTGRIHRPPHSSPDYLKSIGAGNEASNGDTVSTVAELMLSMVGTAAHSHSGIELVAKQLQDGGDSGGTVNREPPKTGDGQSTRPGRPWQTALNMSVPRRDAAVQVDFGVAVNGVDNLRQHLDGSRGGVQISAAVVRGR